MDWTVGTFWTVETDSRRFGLIGDRLDSWERRRPGGIEPGSAAVPAALSLGAPPWVTRLLRSCSSAPLAPVGAADWGQRGNGTHLLTWG